MNRKQFIRNSSLIASGAGLGLTNFQSLEKSGTVKPNRLRPGDSVSLIAPSGPINDEKLQKAVSNLESLDLHPKIGKNIMAQNGYMAGTDRQRLDDLHAAYDDKDSKAVWCIRGGDGGNRLLPYVNYELIRSNPKILIGFSDITALLNAIYRTMGIIGYHGPIGAWDFSEYNLKHLKATLFDPTPNHIIEGNSNTSSLVNGTSTGVLVGGNLTLMSVLSGTPYALDYRDKIVFFEDVGEKPRRIDRMITQLRQNGLTEAKGIVLGQFVDCEAGPDDLSLTLDEVLEDRLSDLGIPVIKNFPFGHDSDLCTFPIGLRARLDTQSKTVELLERATK